MKRLSARVHVAVLLVLCVVIVLAAAIIFPMFNRADSHATSADRCAYNLHTLAAATLAYAHDHGRRLPDARVWAAEVRPYAPRDSLYLCPNDDPGRMNSYAMVPALSGARVDHIAHPETQPMLYESDARGRFAQRHIEGRHGYVAFADGHLKLLGQAPAGIPPAAP